MYGVVCIRLKNFLCLTSFKLGKKINVGGVDFTGCLMDVDRSTVVLRSLEKLHMSVWGKRAGKTCRSVGVEAVC